DSAGIFVSRDRSAAPFGLDRAAERGVERDLIPGYSRNDAIESQLKRLPLLGALGIGRPRRDAVHADEMNPLGVAKPPDDQGDAAGSDLQLLANAIATRFQEHRATESVIRREV